MVRSLGGLALVVLAVGLTACAAASGGAGSAPSRAAAPSATPSGPSLDGDWIVQAGGTQAPCVGVNERTVTIAHGTSTLAVAIVGTATSSPALTGPAGLDVDAVTIHMERSSPTKDAFDVTGTLGADGVIHGTATAGGIHPGGTNGYTCTFPVALVRAVAAGEVPAFDTIAGTWCSADDPQTCMTIAGGKVSFGDDPPEATLDEPKTSGFGLPCYVSAATPTQPGGGFVIYYCPKGMVVKPGGGGVEGDIVAEHDNVAFDRIYITQNPPYLGVYFRQQDLRTALTTG